MCSDLGGTVSGLMEYILDLDDIAGTNAERRIDEFNNLGKEATQSYKTKKTTGKPNSHLSRYTPEQLKFMRTELADMLFFFGYVNHPTEKNTNDYFQYDFEHVESETLENYYRFRKVNEESK